MRRGIENDIGTVFAEHVLHFALIADKILIAMPSAPKAQVKRIYDICGETDCKVKTLPGIYQIVLFF